MTDIEKSVNLAQKLHCHKFVIQHYISQKDRLSLLAYQMRVASHEEEHLMIDNALQYVSTRFIFKMFNKILLF